MSLGCSRKIRISAVFFVFVCISLITVNGVHATSSQILGNFTINSTNYVMASDLNYSGWLIIETGAHLNAAGYTIQAKDILLKKGAVLNIPNGSKLINYQLFNNGTINYVPNFLNITNFYNYGVISHQNQFNHYVNLPYSYGGSGGGGGSNYGGGATQGLNTRVSGGAVGNDPADPGSQASLLGNLSSPLFNESILSGAAGGNSSCTTGAFGAYGFIIRTKNFVNTGTITNNGGQAPYVCYNFLYNGGGGGAGGGGVLEIVYAKTYVDNGTYNLNGGALNSDFNGPWTYGGWGGQGGNGQTFIIKFPYLTQGVFSNNTINYSSGGSNESNPNSTLTANKQNISITSYPGNLSYLNKTVTSMNKTLYGLLSSINFYGQELSSLSNLYSFLAYGISQGNAANNILQKDTENNLTKYYSIAVNESSYLNKMSIDIQRYNQPAVYSYISAPPEINILNSSGYSLIQTNFNSGNSTFNLNIERTGYYKIQFSSGNKYIYLNLNTATLQDNAPKQNQMSMLPSYVISSVFFLPF